MTPSDPPVRRKPYQSPRLIVYGDVREITQAGPNMGKANDNITGMNKTG
jgi:hypothetical protein